ncbi:uncharacterized protein [Dendrobates tinctorius]|uniref:uncharacterized protein n=1 Tax=Dendrobates tinctorius TaxID=92724 RepID=UPI003CC936A1
MSFRIPASIPLRSSCKEALSETSRLCIVFFVSGMSDWSGAESEFTTEALLEEREEVEAGEAAIFPFTMLPSLGKKSVSLAGEGRLAAFPLVILFLGGTQLLDWLPWATAPHSSAQPYGAHCSHHDTRPRPQQNYKCQQATTDRPESGGQNSGKTTDSPRARLLPSVIPGHPTLARVVVAGTFFILAAVIAGLFLFFYIYCRHKDEYADLEEGLLSRRRCFKPQLEDVEAGLPTYKTTPVAFRRAPLRTFWRTEKEDDDSYTRSKKTFQGLANILGRKTRTKMRDDDRQVDDGDLRKLGKDRNMTEVKEKLKTEQKRSSDMSDPLKKKDKGDHKKKEDGETSKKDNKSTRKTETSEDN